MPLKQGYKYPDSQVVCGECGRSFRTNQGMLGHKRLVHGLSPGGFPGGVGALPRAFPGENRGRGGLMSGTAESLPTPGVSIEALEGELKRLRISSEIEKLKAPARQKPVDVSELLGMGPLAPEVSAGIQSRAFSLQSPPPPPDMTPVLIELIKTLAERPAPAPTPPPNGGHRDGLDLLKEMGIDIMSLLTQKSAPSGLMIGKLDLSNLPLDSAAVSALIESQASITSSESTKAMIMEGIQMASKYAPVASQVVGQLMRGLAMPKASPMVESAPEPSPILGQALPCPTCGSALQIGEVGESITCPACESVFDVEMGESYEQDSGPEASSPASAE